MKSPKEIIEEFDERFEEDRYESVPEDMDVEVEKVKSFLMNSHIKAIESDIRRLQDKFESEYWNDCRTPDEQIGYRYAQLDEISHKQQQLKEWRDLLDK